MHDRERIKKALVSNLKWFQNSGVMVPNNGLWGVAERVALKGNSSMDKIYRHFPAWTEFEKYSVIEQRRADCNFETALLFLFASDVLKDGKYRKIAENILDFLYFRSGMLNRFPVEKNLTGAWFWSHIGKGFWFDDNSWNCVIPLIITERYPELEEKYEMRKWALMLAENMAEAFMTHFQAADDFKNSWSGNLKLPHWGSLVCMAMAKAHTVSRNPLFRKVADAYHKYLDDNKDSFIASEIAYAAIGAGFCCSAFKEDKFKRIAEFFGDNMIKRMEPETGNIPAEHYEAPLGPHLADTIYTVNWALMGFQILYSVNGQEKYRKAFLKLLDMIVSIQDKSPEKHVKGCWRGMYDLKAGDWGGGDCYEGGANSIYTGWTNAPIAICLAIELSGKYLIDKR
jgi:hypothetical protein